MLRMTLKNIIAGLLGAFLIIGVVYMSYKSSAKSLQPPSEEEITAVDNVGIALSDTERSTIVLSRASAVQVMSLQVPTGRIAASSGTYVEYKGDYFVLTTAHGIGNQCSATHIVVDQELHDCISIVFKNIVDDWAVIQVESLPNRTAVRIPDQIPRPQELQFDFATQNTTYYTGYPNHGGPYTFDGRIVAYSDHEGIFIDSYGWSGSSGSGVFSASGNLIGVVMGLEIGETNFGTAVLENFIWVIPITRVNWTVVGIFAE
tara:strand:- start:1274 stop:2053 length:780 start_codon:yes stop_codon:yes gene_type:complete